MKMEDLNDIIKGLETQKKRKLVQITEITESITRSIDKNSMFGISVCVQNIVRVEQELVSIQGQLTAYETVRFQNR